MRVSTAVCPVLCRCSRRISRRWWMSKCSAVWPVWCDLRQGSLLQGGVRSGAQHLCSSRVSFSHVRWFDAFEPGERAGTLFGMRTGWCFWCSESWLFSSDSRLQFCSGQCLAVPPAGVLGVEQRRSALLRSRLVQCCNSFCVYPCIFLAVVCVVWCPVVTPGRLMALLIQSWAFEPSV
jgi:hypothetical protein